jgi:uncharacterized protein YkwD
MLPLGMLACLLVGPPQLPQGGNVRPYPSYERWVQPGTLAPHEQRLAGAVQHWARAQPLHLRYDWRLHAAAAALLDWAQVHAGAALPLDQVQRAAWIAGSTDAGLCAVALRACPDAQRTAVQKALAQLFVQGDLNRFGVAHKGDTAVVVLSGQRMRLAPTPICVPPNAHLRLAGQDLDANISAVTLVLGRPDKEVVQLRPQLRGGLWTQTVDVGPDPGILEVQIIIERGRGPEIAAQYPVGVGRPPWPELPRDSDAALGPTPPSAVGTPDPNEMSGRQAAVKLQELVWATRRAHGLSRPTPHPQLMRAAQAHADDMRRHHFFAHVSPRGGNAAQRLRARHMPFTRVIEDIAASPSVDAAMVQWMQSPAHRAKLLDPVVDTLGVGIALGPPPTRVWAVLLMAQLP